METNKEGWYIAPGTMKMLRVAYRVPNHIPDEQLKKYIHVKNTKNLIKTMRLEVVEDALTLGIPYLKH